MNAAQKVANEILAMSPQEQLRLAAAMMDAAKTATPEKRAHLLGSAKAITSRISAELGAVAMFADLAALDSARGSK
jgi:uncharacterized protein (DUF885 family)